MSDNICYTGIGARKRNHTRKEFMQLMKKNFRKQCAVSMKRLKCKSCKKSTAMNTKEGKKQVRAIRNNKPYKLTAKKEQELVKQINKCDRCTKKNTRRCNFKNYLSFSGAELGKCKQNISDSNKSYLFKF